MNCAEMEGNWSAVILKYLNSPIISFSAITDFVSLRPILYVKDVIFIQRNAS